MICKPVWQNRSKKPVAKYLSDAHGWEEQHTGLKPSEQLPQGKVPFCDHGERFRILSIRSCACFRSDRSIRLPAALGASCTPVCPLVCKSVPCLSVIAISLSIHHLRREIFRSTARCSRPLLVLRIDEVFSRRSLFLGTRIGFLGCAGLQAWGNPEPKTPPNSSSTRGGTSLIIV